MFKKKKILIDNHLIEIIFLDLDVDFVENKQESKSSISIEFEYIKKTKKQKQLKSIIFLFFKKFFYMIFC